MQFNRLLLFLLAILLVTVFASCERRSGSGIPFFPVNYQLTVSNPEFADLLAIGGWVYIGGGSRGIIVYRFLLTNSAPMTDIAHSKWRTIVECLWTTQTFLQ